jgi:prolyl oligopeptidase
MPAAPPSYPPAPRDPSVVDVLHGREVPDPYRALEDPDAPVTRAFCAAQNDLTRSFLDRAAPFRSRVQREIEEIYDYDKYGTPHRRGRWFYYTRHRGLENQAVVMQSASMEIAGDAQEKDCESGADHAAAMRTAAKPTARVFIDPNVLSDDGTASLGEMEWSKDGGYVAYGVQRSGSDWADIHVMNADSLQVLPETLEWAKFYSIAWTHDNKGFYYCRYPTPESLREDSAKDKRGAETDEARNQAVYYHVLNTPQDQDRLVLTDPENSKFIFGLEVSDDGRYLFVSVRENCAPRELLWYVDLSLHFGREADNMVHLIHEFEACFSYIANDGTLVYLHTNINSPRYKLIAIDLSRPAREQWRDIVPEHQADVLSAVYAVHKTYMAVVYMRDVSDFLELRELGSGKLLCDVPLPSVGKVSIWAERANGFITLTFTSFLYPGTIFCCDVGSAIAGQGNAVTQSCMRTLHEMRPRGFDPSLYYTRQEFYESKDGTRVPMFIVGPKEEGPNSKHERPCLLYGYGGFCISLAPYYSIRISSWLHCMNGIYVVANIRGGSEVMLMLSASCAFRNSTLRALLTPLDVSYRHLPSFVIALLN